MKIQKIYFVHSISVQSFKRWQLQKIFEDEQDAEDWKKDNEWKYIGELIISTEYMILKDDQKE